MRQAQRVLRRVVALGALRELREVALQLRQFASSVHQHGVGRLAIGATHHVEGRLGRVHRKRLLEELKLLPGGTVNLGVEVEQLRSGPLWRHHLPQQVVRRDHLLEKGAQEQVFVGRQRDAGDGVDRGWTHGLNRAARCHCDAD
eukprot:1830582-Prymnesium_polylepis.1